MPQGDEVYGLMWRGDVPQRGLGIGLYVAQRIASAHGASITHRCVPVSDFNVPLIEAYIGREFDGKDMALVPVLRAELARLSEEDQYHDIVARGRSGDLKYTPTDVTLAREIRRPIYRVRVEVVFPRK
jgi:hypothetical protein